MSNPIKRLLSNLFEPAATPTPTSTLQENVQELYEICCAPPLTKRQHYEALTHLFGRKDEIVNASRKLSETNPDIAMALLVNIGTIAQSRSETLEQIFTDEYLPELLRIAREAPENQSAALHKKVEDFLAKRFIAHAPAAQQDAPAIKTPT